MNLRWLWVRLALFGRCTTQTRADNRVIAKAESMERPVLLAISMLLEFSFAGTRLHGSVSW